MSHKISRKVPGKLSREELAAAQLKAKKRNEERRLKTENEMTMRRIGEQKRTTTKIEYKCHYPTGQNINERLRFEKVEITTTTTLCYSGNQWVTTQKKPKKYWKQQLPIK